jgi:hypothetical protein
MRDPHVKRFVQRSARDAAKYFNIGDIAGILHRFGEDYKKVFHDSILNTRAHIAWDNIYSNRQAVAHGSGVQMSFGDLTKNYAESILVIDVIVTALNLKPRELRDLK